MIEIAPGYSVALTWCCTVLGCQFEGHRELVFGVELFENVHVPQSWLFPSDLAFPPRLRSLDLN